MECSFCNAVLSTLSSLKRHQLTNKSCLEFQCKQSDKTSISDKYACSGCKRIFGRKDSYILHIKSCKYNLSNTIEKLEDEITRLKQENATLRIENNSLRAKPLSSVNIESNITVVNLIQEHFIPLTDELLSESSKTMTINHLRYGGEFMGSLALSTALKSDWSLIVTDYSRKKSMHKQDNIVIKDTRVQVFSQRWSAVNLRRAETLYDNFKRELEKENLDVRELVEYVSPYVETLNGLQQTSKGRFGTKFFKDFSRVIIQGKINPGIPALMDKAIHKEIEDVQSYKSTLTVNGKVFYPPYIMTKDGNTPDAVTPKGMCRIEEEDETIDDYGDVQDIIFVSFVPNNTI